MKDKADSPIRDKKVIDADNHRILDFFRKSETESKLKFYQDSGRWNDVSVDRNGDIILWVE